MKYGIATTLSILMLTAAAAASNGDPQDPKPRTAPRAATTARPAIAVRTAPEAAAAFFGDPSGSYLGVDVREIDSDRVAALKLKEERGVEITEVDQDAPAGKFGLKVKDVILEFNGQRVDSTEQLRRLLHETPGGRSVTLGIWRDGGPQQVNVTVAARKEMVAKIYSMPKMKKMDPDWTPNVIEIPEMPEMPDMPEMPAVNVIVTSSMRGTGLMVDNLTPQLAEYFGAKNGGVLVRSVEKGSAGESGGVKAGDVIVKIDDERIEDRGDLRRAFSKKSGKVGVVVIREKKEVPLSLTLPERRRPKDDSMLGPRHHEEIDIDIDPEAAVDVARLAEDHARHATEMALAEVREGLDQARMELRDKIRIEMPRMQEVLREKIRIDQDGLRLKMDELRDHLKHMRHTVDPDWM
ncbi:MAG: PDZ domain-containing protein [Acidobacteriales bacterium]|nr:PDZ domain-containing protein [Terriglobales bacterium]